MTLTTAQVNKHMYTFLWFSTQNRGPAKSTPVTVKGQDCLILVEEELVVYYMNTCLLSPASDMVLHN